MRRRPTVDININHERWLISYADFITLLFAFFVVMYSISQVSESKYRVLSETMAEIFNEPKRSLQPIQVGEISRSNQATPIESAAVNQKDDGQGAFDKSADLPQLLDQFADQFSDLIDDEVVQVNSNEYWLQISLNNSILFPLGSVKPGAEANVVLSKIADLLRDFNNPIQVEGYTDNVTVRSKQFPSNWELSTARASSVVKFLVDKGLSPERLAAVGYGQYQPIAENETPEGRAQNRRVVLMIAREKMQRPQVNTEEAIAEAIKPVQTEQTQVNPQPGLEVQAPKVFIDENLSPREKMDLLIESNQALGLDTVLTLEDELPVSETIEVPAQQATEENKIVPVETENGGLLFSSDPEQRTNR